LLLLLNLLKGGRSLRYLGTLILIVALTLTGCAQQLENIPQGKETEETVDQNKIVEMKLASTEDMDSLDPLKINSPLEFQLTRAIYDSLFLLDEKSGSYVPELAAKYEENQENTGLIIFLKDNVKFHDGTDLTAPAVKLSLDRWKAAVLPSSWHPLKSVEILDEKSLLITWNRSKQELLAALASPRASIISPNALAAGIAFKGGGYFSPVSINAGTGPYKLQEWVSHQWLSLVSNNDYFGETPKVKRWEIRLGINPEDALVSFKAERFDFVQGMDSRLAQLGSDLGLKDNLEFYELKSGLYLKVNKEQFKELESRQALSGIINRSEISLLLKGIHQPLEYFLPQDSYGSKVPVGNLVDPNGVSTLFEKELIDVTLVRPVDVNSHVTKTLEDVLQEKGIKLKQPKEEMVSLSLVLWTEPYLHPYARLLLWANNGLVSEESEPSPYAEQDWYQYIASLEQQFASDVQLIPLLKLRQVLFANEDNRMVQDEQGLLEFAKVGISE